MEYKIPNRVLTIFVFHTLMTPSDRFRLRFGPYRTPRFKYGDVVLDEARDCEVVSLE